VFKLELPLGVFMVIGGVGALVALLLGALLANLTGRDFDNYQ
jgi:hypothetical protein